MKLSEGLKTVFLAGVGAVAVTGEKSKQLIDDLVKRGELTVEEGKTLNQDLAKKFNERTEGFKPDKLTQSIRDVIYNVEKMTQDERDALRSKLDAADQAAKDALAEVEAILEDALEDDTAEAEQEDAVEEAFDAAADGTVISEEAAADGKEVVEEIIEEAVEDATAEAEGEDAVEDAFDASAGKGE